MNRLFVVYILLTMHNLICSSEKTKKVSPCFTQGLPLIKKRIMTTSLYLYKNRIDFILFDA